MFEFVVKCIIHIHEFITNTRIFENNIQLGNNNVGTKDFF